MAQSLNKAASFANYITGFSCGFIPDTKNYSYSIGEYMIVSFETWRRRIEMHMDGSFSSATHIKIKRKVRILQAIAR